MFDARLRPLIDPVLNAAGRRLAAAGVKADTVTLAGFACGLAAALAICWHAPLLAALLILANFVSMHVNPRSPARVPDD